MQPGVVTLWKSARKPLRSHPPQLRRCPAQLRSFPSRLRNSPARLAQVPFTAAQLPCTSAQLSSSDERLPCPLARRPAPGSPLPSSQPMPPAVPSNLAGAFNLRERVRHEDVSVELSGIALLQPAFQDPQRVTNRILIHVPFSIRRNMPHESDGQSGSD
jgi:hypothetical protein